MGKAETSVSPRVRNEYRRAALFNRRFSFLRRNHACWLALCLTCTLLGVANAQISPGPLARAHSTLGGDSNCVKCHEVSTRSPSFRCVECHREIASELQLNKGLHATFPRSGPAGAACVKCHSDHNGENFALVHWDPAPRSFDHSKTGYTLNGKHVGVGCRACHSAPHIAPSARSLLSSKDLSRTWLGLSSSCITCHEDKHQGRLGPSCSQCHSTVDWKAAKIDQQHFDHSKTRYPLTGAHRNTACQKCHTAGFNGEPRYAGIQFSKCSDCHTDPHKAEFSQGCDSCHTTSTWKRSSFTSTFDHSKTHYPLMGKHLQVPCLVCHKTADFKAPLSFANCTDCHKPDPHSGQFTSRADAGRCESCHTVTGWSPSTFTAAEHSRTGFPLVTPHAKVKCAECHAPAGKATRYKVSFALCVDCHTDAHERQFIADPWRNRCELCHKGATFKTSSYTLVNHQKSTFPLTGAHQAIACNECHKPPANSKSALYHFSKLDCTTCHQDIHKGEFAQRMTTLNSSGKPVGCEACHSTKAWADVSKFDHANTRFALVGSHRAVACADCHKPPNMEMTLLHVNFASAPTACAECHQNPHADQFGSQAGDCASCHNINKWKPSLFDHERTEFSLKGGHQDVACSACHTLKRSVDGSLVLFYKPTPKACSECHGNAVPAIKQTHSAVGKPASAKALWTS